MKDLSPSVASVLTRGDIRLNPLFDLRRVLKSCFKASSFFWLQLKRPHEVVGINTFKMADNMLS